MNAVSVSIRCMDNPAPRRKKVMNWRCNRTCLALLSLMLVALFVAPAAHAGATIIIDGNPADMKAAALAAPAGLGFDLDSTNQASELCNAVLRVKSNWSASCSYTNAYDLTHGEFLLDVNGAAVTLYA